MGFSQPFYYSILKQTPDFTFKLLKHKHVFRSGVALSYSKKYESVSFKANLGYERRTKVKRFQLLGGIDVGMELENSDFFNKYRLYHFGIGPVGGFIFNITRRFSIESELGLFYGPYIYYINNYKRTDILFSSHRAFSLHLYYKF